MAITSADMGGKSGVRLDIVSIEPSVISRPSSLSDENYVTDVAAGVMTGLQKAGILPKALNPKMTIFLTMSEYEVLGKPQINEVLDMLISKNKIELIPVSQK